MNASKSIARLLPKATLLLGNKGRFIHTLEEGFRMVRGKKKFSAIREDLYDLFHLAFAAFKGEYRGLNKKNLLMIVAGLLYLVNPWDIIPDFILGFGLTDDLAILTYIIKKLAKEIESYRFWLKERV